MTLQNPLQLRIKEKPVMVFKISAEGLLAQQSAILALATRGLCGSTASDQFTNTSQKARSKAY